MDAVDLPPLPTSAKQARIGRDAFDVHAQAILDEWTKRQGAKAGRRAESPNAWFKREAYALIAHYVRLGLTSTFRQGVRRDMRSTRLVEEALKNPFKLGLLAMFSDESPLSNNHRHVFGNQMLYAWAHDVPPEFLNAFLAISGGPELIARKLKGGNIEPGFERRFKPDRLPEALR